MAQLVVDLPGHNGLLVLVVLRHGPDDALPIVVQVGAVEAGHVPPAEGAGHPGVKLGEDVRVLVGQPGGDGGGGGAHDHLQPVGFGPVDDVVKEGEVVLTLPGLHDVPAELGDADHVASQLHDVVQILLQQGGVPLFGVIVYAKKHGYDSTFFSRLDLSCCMICSI